MSQPSKALLAEWAKKLKDSGFKDIENSDNSLGQFHGSRWFSREINLSQMAIQREYFAKAGEFLNHYTKFTPFTKQLWELHAEGHSAREIAAIVKTHGKSSVFNTIKVMQGELLAWCNEVDREQE